MNRRLALYAQPPWRQRFASACTKHAAVAPKLLVLYDVTTHYFESDTGDGFRHNMLKLWRLA